MALILVVEDDQVATCQDASRWKMLRCILVRCPPSCCLAQVDAEVWEGDDLSDDDWSRCLCKM